MIRSMWILIICILLQSCSSSIQSHQLAVGKDDFNAGNFTQSFHQLLPLAAEGNASAQYAVGYMYYYGYGVSKDTESGLFWMQKAADQHYLPAIRALDMLGK